MFIIAAVLTVFVAFADAQEPKRPSNFMSAQLSEQLLNETQALSHDKLVNAQANLLRKHYLALIDAGFTKSEALKIVVAMAGQDK